MNLSDGKTESVSPISKPTVLIVDDLISVCENIKIFIEDQYDIIFAHSFDDGLLRVIHDAPAVVLLDIDLDDTRSGFDLLEIIIADRYAPPVIMLTADGEIETIVRAIHGGATNYLHKPPNPTVLLGMLDRALIDAAARRKAMAFERDIEGKMQPFIHLDPAMKAIIDYTDKIAQSDAAILLTGESGTGKELIAHRIHNNSPRRNGPFITVNCAAERRARYPT